jgi:acyl-CoA thioester hydrolase
MTDAATKSFIDRLIPGYRGVAQSWECDLMGHLNVSHYFGRASDHSAFTRFKLGMGPREMAALNRGTVALEEHGRFLQEVKAGGMMVGRSAPFEIGERTMGIYQEFRDADDTLLTSFKTLIGHFDTANRKLIPWTAKTLELAHGAKIDLPDHAAPAHVPAGSRVTPMSLAQSQEAGFHRIGGNIVNAWECDQFGHMNTMFYIRRQTEAVPHMWHRLGINLSDMRAEGRGFAVGEMRMSYVNELLAGDVVETWTAIREVKEKTLLAEHRLYNAETGQLAAISLVRAVHFDLTTRRAVAWSDETYAKINQNMAALES